LTSIEKGDPNTKINASAIFPHDIVRGWIGSNRSTDRQEIRAADAQWNALPDYMGENSGKVLVMADVSGSMTGGYGSTLTPMDVSVSLALYTAERAKGPFKGFFMTFSGSPSFVKIQGANIYEKIMNISRSNWSMSTNIQAAFDAILDRAKQHSVPQSDMPETLLIISDMEFDACAGHQTNFEAARQKFSASGYLLPSIVFWNVRASGGNIPVKVNTRGVGLVSGFNPSVLTSILGGEATPMAILDRAINQSGRYDAVNV
jgi:hypothetical protein